MKIRLWRRVAVLGLLLGLGTALVGSTTANAITVPNMFVRTCSHITGQCTGYHQTNKPNPSVGKSYTTIWCYCWIF